MNPDNLRKALRALNDTPQRNEWHIILGPTLNSSLTKDERAYIEAYGTIIESKYMPSNEGILCKHTSFQPPGFTLGAKG